ncbi:MAG TPA: winged helix-turn-helix domain-containing protein [Sphingomicrobium sp.]|nr:winged helix-turn-helix domain-containing protein [Sphingomicrobium sp.]
MAHNEISRAHSVDSDTRALLISDAARADSLRQSLERAPLDVHFSRSGPQAIAAALQSRPHMVLVDCRSDVAKALLICEHLRAVSETASAHLIVITREDHAELRIEAIEAGADDCFAEPSTSRELWSRLDFAKRRIRNDVSSEVLLYADVELDLRRHKVRRDGRLIWLSALQLRLLKFFMENPAVVFTRQELLEAVWGDKELDEGTVTVAVVRLRRALNSTGRPNLIRQVRGFGYALDADLDK